MRKLKTILRKGAALGAVCAMTLTSLPMQSVAAAEQDGAAPQAEGSRIRERR